jgi:hypothetical protein
MAQVPAEDYHKDLESEEEEEGIENEEDNHIFESEEDDEGTESEEDDLVNTQLSTRALHSMSVLEGTHKERRLAGTWLSRSGRILNNLLTSSS